MNEMLLGWRTLEVVAVIACLAWFIWREATSKRVTRGTLEHSLLESWMKQKRKDRLHVFCDREDKVRILNALATAAEAVRLASLNPNMADGSRNRLAEQHGQYLELLRALSEQGVRESKVQSLLEPDGQDKKTNGYPMVYAYSNDSFRAREASRHDKHVSGYPMAYDTTEG